MIKVFCDCCGKEIPFKHLPNVPGNTMVTPFKRVTIKKDHWSEDYLVQLIITANIYKPENLLNEIKSENLVGHSICPECVVEVITQKEE